MPTRFFLTFVRATLLFAALLPSQTVPGLNQSVEILRDRWGVPHIYASTVHDLFFAQGYITAKDRLFQMDLWRRAGTGRLAEVLGPAAIDRDRLARSVQFRGNWDTEWNSYGPDTRTVVTAFTDGINAYIRSLGGKRPTEFKIAGYDPGLWTPEDCLSRVAGLLMTRNLANEVRRAQAIREFGIPSVQKSSPPDPVIPITIPDGLDLAEITAGVLREYNEAIAGVRLDDQGSNNWVVDGTMTVTGKPILANDPHRPVQIPSLRKTVHLVAPGWNVIGAGEPALPGIALGHNENIAFGFTIVGIDQQDLYVEKVNPAHRDEYSYRGKWKKFEVEQEKISVKGQGGRTVELRFTVHGPVIHEDPARHRAYVLRWVGSEPGTAGYLAGISLARASNWTEFQTAMERYKVPSENVVYADVKGNIGWQVGGLSPIRNNWSGLLPVPGDSGQYEWAGFRKMAELPNEFNPARHFIATANNNILPPNFPFPLGYEWTPPFRVERIREMLTSGKKFDIADFERMQQDVVSTPARRFQATLRNWPAPEGTREAKFVNEILKWDAAMTMGSRPALIYEVWSANLGAAEPEPSALARSLRAALLQIEKTLGPDENEWKWGRLHEIYFRHPLNVPALNRGPISRPGDAYTVNATSGLNFHQTSGASYRQILDVADWDRSVTTNAPGESGDPDSPHYSDLLQPWAAGVYHPLPFTRKAVEAATEERIVLQPLQPGPKPGRAREQSR